MAWTNTGGGDHEGADWTPADTTIIAGVHYNINTFLVTNGWTININPANELEIYGDIITVTGILDGIGDGFASESGTRPGGRGGPDANDGGGGGGAGYGGSGGAGAAGAGAGGYGGSAGGTIGTTDTSVIAMGSGGGCASKFNGEGSCGAAGGKGGASIYLSANTITVTGTINCTGGTGGTDGAGAGGGAGGGILFVGGAVTVSGTLLATGGAGRNNTSSNCGSGGGGGGGRIKILYRTLNTAGSTITAAGGAAGAGTRPATAGSAGTTTNTEIKCNSTYAMGQTFTPDSAITGKFYISEIRLWAMAVTISDKVFTMTVYNDSAKGTNYGSTTLTISSTGEKTFIFEPWLELPTTNSQYYLELTTPDGDVDFGTEGNEPLSGEDLYFKVVLVEKFTLYIRVFGSIPIINPQVYNNADTTVKCDVANTMLAGAIHRINTDGTGTFEYSDNFTTAKYSQDATTAGTVAYDNSNDELDISASSSIYWKCDVKYPITSIPILTSIINITAGTPTIKIAVDSGGSPDTWYDITTAIVDDVETEYELDSISLHLKGNTIFYFKVDCGAGITASVKSIKANADIVTIDAENPKITSNGASTIKCTQAATSGLNCDVSLIYRDRSWAV